MTKQIFLDTDPDNQFVEEKYVIYVDITERLLTTPEGRVRYAKKALREELGDDVELEKVKFKRPKITTRSVDKLFRRVPQAKLYVVTKF
jgi:hypothetical protein